MINATLRIIHEPAFFQEFYSKLCALFESEASFKKKQALSLNTMLQEQDPLWISAAQIQGHAIKKKESDNAMITCASVSMLCKSISAVLGRNMQDLVRLEAESEGHFAFSSDSEVLLQRLSAPTFHRYVELFGAMKTFAVGLKLLAQKEPTELQLNIHKVLLKE